MVSEGGFLAGNRLFAQSRKSFEVCRAGSGALSRGESGPIMRRCAGCFWLFRREFFCWLLCWSFREDSLLYFNRLWQVWLLSNNSQLTASITASRLAVPRITASDNQSAFFKLRKSGMEHRRSTLSDSTLHDRALYLNRGRVPFILGALNPTKRSKFA